MEAACEKTGMRISEAVIRSVLGVINLFIEVKVYYKYSNEGRIENGLFLGNLADKRPPKGGEKGGFQTAGASPIPAHGS